MNLEVGTQLGDYQILSRIGKGAYGVVFEAEHSITRRIDAVKLMLDAGHCSSDEEQRFLREIQAQASLQHPNIATVYGAFHTDWGLALSMELVKGKSLRTILQAGPLSPAAAVAYILAVLDGLSCAERLGIVHRDIKPDNILITEDGTVKLTDFGLAQIANTARITSSGENLGTPCYMSPEQVTGAAPADARSDIYSTGVVLYEAVTGRPPFTGSNGFAVMLAHQNTAPVPPIELQRSVGAELNRVILKALEKDPLHRFQTAAEFHSALAHAASSVKTMPPKPRRAKRRLGTAALIAAATTATLGICAFGAWVGHVSVHHAESATPSIAKPAKQVSQPVVAAPVDPPAAPAPVPEPQTEAAVPTVPAPARPHPVRRTQKPNKPPADEPAVAFSPPPARAAAPEPVAAKHPVLPPEPGIAPAIPPHSPPSELPAAIGAATPEPITEPAKPKRRNIFRRAFGKIFGHGTATPESAAPATKPSTTGN